MRGKELGLGRRRREGVIVETQYRRDKQRSQLIKEQKKYQIREDRIEDKKGDGTPF